MPNPSTTPLKEYFGATARTGIEVSQPNLFGKLRANSPELIFGNASGTPTILEYNDVFILSVANPFYGPKFAPYGSARDPQEVINWAAGVELDNGAAYKAALKTQLNALLAIEDKPGIFHKAYVSGGNEICSFAASFAVRNFWKAKMGVAGNPDYDCESVNPAGGYLIPPSGWQVIGAKAYDTKLIPYFVCYHLAILAEAVTEVEAAYNAANPGGTRTILLTCGSITNLRNPDAVPFLTALLDYTIPADCPTAVSLRGKKVREIVDLVEYHYLTQANAFVKDTNGKWVYEPRTVADGYNWQKRMQQVWANVGTGTIIGSHETEFVGRRSSKIGQGAISGLQGIARTLWFAHLKNRGPRAISAFMMDWAVPGTQEFPGGGPMYENGSAWKVLDLIDKFIGMSSSIVQSEFGNLNSSMPEWGSIENYVWNCVQDPKKYVAIAYNSDADDATLTHAANKLVYQNWLKTSTHIINNFTQTSVASIVAHFFDVQFVNGSACKRVGRRQQITLPSSAYTIDTVNKQLKITFPAGSFDETATPCLMMFVTAS